MKRLWAYPHELSGGMRQRLLIAMALVNRPKLVIADEPTTALDVTIQAQVLDLLMQLQKEFGMALLFITHDMGVVAQIADVLLLCASAPKRCQSLKKLPKIINAGVFMSALFEVKQLDVAYQMKNRSFLALRDIDLEGFLGQTLGVVGESGCGKSTLAKTLMCIHPATHGKVFFDGKELTNLSPREQRKALKGMQMIFQDPDASLNPRMTVEGHLKEAIQTSKVEHAGTYQDYIKELLDMVQLPHSLAKMYPYQLSGGQKQRVSIARALSVKPKLLICDEPLSSLDVSVVAQIILLLKKIQQEHGISYLFITHDLATLSYLAHRLVVLYLGRVMEVAPAAAIFEEPLHPYTQALMASIPTPDPEAQSEPAKLCIVGDPPSAVDPPSGCVFHTRCPYAQEACRHIVPRLREIKPGHHVACHLYAQ